MCFSKNSQSTPDSAPSSGSTSAVDLQAFFDRNIQVAADTIAASYAAQAAPTAASPSPTLNAGGNQTRQHNTPAQLIASTPGVVWNHNSPTINSVVKARFSLNQNNSLLLKRHISGPFSHNNKRYDVDQNAFLILLTGHMFEMASVPNEKKLLRSNFSFRVDSYWAARSSFHELVNLLHQCGFFALPLFLHQKGHGDNGWGFTLGDTVDDDIPSRMLLHINNTRDALYSFLDSDRVFPQGSLFRPSCFINCNRDGHQVLRNIAKRIGLLAFDEPEQLIRRKPTYHKCDSLAEFYKATMDFNQLVALIEGCEISYDNEIQRNLFILSCRHGDWLKQAMDDDIKLHPSHVTYNNAKNLLESLETLLASSNSPANKKLFNKTKAPENLSTSTQDAAIDPAFRTNVHALGQVPLNPVDFSSTAKSQAFVPPLPLEPPPNMEVPSMWNIDRELDKLQSEADSRGPDAVQDLESYKVYINAVRTSPSTVRNCILCGIDHPFDDCKILKDHEFLKNHFIRSCQVLRQDLRYHPDLNIRPPPSNDKTRSLRPTKQEINALTTINPIVVEQDAEDDDDSVDFVTGRVRNRL